MIHVLLNLNKLHDNYFNEYVLGEIDRDLLAFLLEFCRKSSTFSFFTNFLHRFSTFAVILNNLLEFPLK